MKRRKKVMKGSKFCGKKKQKPVVKKEKPVVKRRKKNSDEKEETY